ncbi:phosphoribosylaminoimidazolesuccinocarboxamide synthase [Gryllotalpicola protaetiae]|uniref:Phosphoribosylaminoimidazole-succinocarboxamide synthase n=1 Tax=Gryllotalpicola protaetiae TaxID=2419771 RepID=A0A387BMH6_9MICO|nr:phosphoribosylaminoimidazolesuccinocarboxamide synthase [Gryllotalpicola protaetiae]AYG03234.1 phosphoribosylaminoimidazolesuccinocarboxamide synthase [Gryllotalpicola protaetiae]
MPGTRPLVKIGSVTAQVLPGWTHAYSGKVRDLYVPEGTTDADAPELLVVASDRVSAFDFVLAPGIPGKGELLTTLSNWWFSQLADVPNHLVPGGGARIPSEVAGRAMLVKPLEMFPIECVVRGFITGSGWAEYQESQSVTGIPLPAGLRNGDRLPAPIFTPAWKAPQGEHDENITFDRMVELVGEPAAVALRELSLKIYTDAAAKAETQGLIVADTKFEFGSDTDGVITLADEVLTPDSSRYWDLATWNAGATPDERMASFDKQIVRDWLAANWDRQGTPPELPPVIVAQTAARYAELIERLAA